MNLSVQRRKTFKRIAVVLMVFAVMALAVAPSFAAPAAPAPSVASVFAMPASAVSADAAVTALNSHLVAVSSASADPAPSVVTIKWIQPKAPRVFMRQDPTPVPFQFSGVFNGYVSSANRWITSLSPIFTETGGIQIALVLLLLVGGLIVAAFLSMRGGVRK